MENKVKGWGELPNVVMVEVYKYLSIEDRLNASSVCINWRLPCFQVPLRESLNLRLKGEEDIPRIRFLSDQFIHKVKHVQFTFDAATPNCLEVCDEALQLLEANKQLKTLKMNCTDDSIAHPLFHQNDTNSLIKRNYFVKKVLGPLLRVLQARNQLEKFSFPLIQNLSSFGNKILTTLLDSRKRYSISDLFIASVRSAVLNIPSVPFVSSVPEMIRIDLLVKLQMLSVDHDSLTDEVLAKIGLGNIAGGLKRLNLVAIKGNPNVSNNGWTAFVANNPKCKVRLTICGGSSLVNHSSNLLFPSIPLTHFRTYHCKEMRMDFLCSVVRWNENTLEHLELVDEDFDWIEFLVEEEHVEDQIIDPFVYAAWRCRKLSTIKIGFFYCGHSLVGIARLRGPTLTRLEIPKSHIVCNSIRRLSKDVSNALKRPWKPMTRKQSLTLRYEAFHADESSLLQTHQAVQSDEV